MSHAPFTCSPTAWSREDIRDLTAGTVKSTQPAVLLREIRKPILADRIVLVGESNPRSTDPRRALAPLPSNHSGGRLAKILGLDVKDYLRTFYRLNLFHPAPKHWDAAEARRRAARVLGEMPLGARFLLVGQKVAAAFGIPYEPFKVARRDGFSFLVLPHPSGLCRTWNDPRSATRARRAFRGIMAA